MSRLCFIAESGTDIRLVEGLASRFNLSILARRIDGGFEISQPLRKALPVVIGPASRFKFAIFVLKYLRANRQGIDRVFVQGYGLAALAANLVSRLNRIPTAMLVCSPVEAYYLCRKTQADGDKRFLRRELFALQALAWINAIVGRQYIVLSQHLARVVRKPGIRRLVSIISVYGIDTSVFTPSSESKASIRARLGLPTTGALIFFSSRVAPEKDSQTLLAAVRTLVEKGRNIWLLHRSGGFQSFVKEAERIGIAARVIATDAVHPHEKLFLDYQASDLCIQASREEGLGFSPLEALACEVPVVATSVGGLKETILDGQTGWTYAVGDQEALVRCVEAVLDDPAEATRRATAGRKMVCARYDQQFVFEQLETMIWKGEESTSAEVDHEGVSIPL
jgi:glycosyltransferase involved in cell wall biosynthesis